MHGHLVCKRIVQKKCNCVAFQWRYCVRLENQGDETVQLRERHWRIFSLSGTLETVRGRGVVGQVILDLNYKHIRFRKKIKCT